jgi:hypothetical protein
MANCFPSQDVRLCSMGFLALLFLWMSSDRFEQRDTDETKESATELGLILVRDIDPPVQVLSRLKMMYPRLFLYDLSLLGFLKTYLLQERK